MPAVSETMMLDEVLGGLDAHEVQVADHRVHDDIIARSCPNARAARRHAPQAVARE